MTYKVIYLVCFILGFFLLATFSKPAYSTSTPYLRVDLQLPVYKTFIFNPRALTWKAVSNGKVIKTGRASGGRTYCSDLKRSCRTPTGSFYIQSKRGADCRSPRYPVRKGGAKMPYCMFYSQYYAIHGSYDVPNYNASHGCIR